MTKNQDPKPLLGEAAIKSNIIYWQSLELAARKNIDEYQAQIIYWQQQLNKDIDC